jgi:hypothetical protein
VVILTVVVLVFTASLVVSGQLLVNKHGQHGPDEAAGTHARQLLDKSDTIFQHLSCDDTLVNNCSQYIRNLSEMNTTRGRCTLGAIPIGGSLAGDHGEATTGTSSSNGTQQPDGFEEHIHDSLPYTGENFGFLHPNVEEMDAFLPSEMIDPSVFEGF